MRENKVCGDGGERGGSTNEGKTTEDVSKGIDGEKE